MIGFSGGGIIMNKIVNIGERIAGGYGSGIISDSAGDYKSSTN